MSSIFSTSPTQPIKCRNFWTGVNVKESSCRSASIQLISRMDQLESESGKTFNREKHSYLFHTRSSSVPRRSQSIQCLEGSSETTLSALAKRIEIQTGSTSYSFCFCSMKLLSGNNRTITISFDKCPMQNLLQLGMTK